ncbi:MAG: hypothetical protein LBC51_08705 [Treponema sp.]|nr:hypothetical protein [Treponema sp.]
MLDNGNHFLSVFREDTHQGGKEHMVGRAGTNCRMWHRIRRAFRKTGSFSQKVFAHWEAFEMVFYIN